MPTAGPPRIEVKPKRFQESRISDSTLELHNRLCFSTSSPTGCYRRDAKRESNSPGSPSEWTSTSHHRMTPPPPSATEERAIFDQLPCDADPFGPQHAII